MFKSELIANTGRRYTQEDVKEQFDQFIDIVLSAREEEQIETGFLNLNDLV